jgi:YesN/AraC family two-component response regulator
MIDYMNLSYVIQKSNESVYSKAKKYILGNMSKPILPKDVCKAIGVSSNTLYKTVKARKGMSPTEFIRKMKIDEAKRLLLGSGDAVSTVAESVGIPDVNYFIRVFKKETGISPLKYRKTVVYGKH